MANRPLRSLTDAIARELGRIMHRAAPSPARDRSRRSAVPAGRPAGRPTPGRGPEPPAAGYPGDFRGRVEIRYAPHPDGEPDPGEVVWAWVPFEEDHAQGKDRPVLLIGRDGPWLLGLQLTSQDHDRDADQERRAGRIWVDIGSGGWDSRRRPSEARVNRVLRIDPGRVRREGAVLDRATFERVAAAVDAHA